MAGLAPSLGGPQAPRPGRAWARRPPSLSRAASAAGWLRAADGQNHAGAPRPAAGCTQTAGGSWGAAKLWSWSPRPTGLFSVDDRERWRVLLAWADLGIKEKTAPGLSSYQPEKEREGIREARGDISCSHLSSGAWEQEMLEAVVRNATDLLNLASSPLQLDFGANESI